MRTLIYNQQPAVINRLFLMLLTLSLSFLVLTANAQTAMKIAPGSQIKVNGTSNIHDWTMAAGSFSCDARITLKQNQVQDITALTFILPVKNLKGKEDLLNSRAHKALKADQHNQIVFKLLSAEPAGKMIKASGNLTIGGVTKEIPMTVNYQVNADESVSITGDKKLKMSDFKISPPSFMMGALKVADEVTVSLNLKFIK